MLWHPLLAAFMLIFALHRESPRKDSITMGQRFLAFLNTVVLPALPPVRWPQDVNTEIKFRTRALYETDAILNSTSFIGAYNPRTALFWNLPGFRVPAASHNTSDALDSLGTHVFLPRTDTQGSGSVECNNSQNFCIFLSDSCTGAAPWSTNVPTHPKLAAPITYAPKAPLSSSERCDSPDNHCSAAYGATAFAITKLQPTVTSGESSTINAPSTTVSYDATRVMYVRNPISKIIPQTTTPIELDLGHPGISHTIPEKSVLAAFANGVVCLAIVLAAILLLRCSDMDAAPGEFESFEENELEASTANTALPDGFLVDPASFDSRSMNSDVLIGNNYPYYRFASPWLAPLMVFINPFEDFMSHISPVEMAAAMPCVDSDDFDDITDELANVLGMYDDAAAAEIKSVDDDIGEVLARPSLPCPESLTLYCTLSPRSVSFTVPTSSSTVPASASPVASSPSSLNSNALCNASPSSSSIPTLALTVPCPPPAILSSPSVPTHPSPSTSIHTPPLTPTKRPPQDSPYRQGLARLHARMHEPLFVKVPSPKVWTAATTSSSRKTTSAASSPKASSSRSSASGVSVIPMDLVRKHSSHDQDAADDYRCNYSHYRNNSSHSHLPPPVKHQPSSPWFPPPPASREPFVFEDFRIPAMPPIGQPLPHGYCPPPAFTLPPGVRPPMCVTEPIPVGQHFRHGPPLPGGIWVPILVPVLPGYGTGVPAQFW
ncbi:hypothetical protein CYLTODRAFT_457360 [Cylindrobasidium torrendii FP15055 ss-10]|uniref:Uncharacterized protein n=1 Tax=Cylindrobasidium torrendii FP15055 ss-10 TaxID=1314674 RepID=A0A0D7B0X6_9AGAR|nr:hypothetical protein CYLTODRAFT_457360 [Cylindrobasidium torrendii FP15055 ss-10]